MRQAGRIFRTLMSHWRRNPLQIGAIMLGLSLATALWSGVNAINAEAKSSYARAASMFGGNDLTVLLPRSGTTIPQARFADLRRAGVMVSPVVEGSLVRGQRRYRIVGIELLSMPPEAAPEGMEAVEGEGLPAFFQPPWEILADPDTAEALRGETDGLPPIRTTETMMPDLLITDIGVAQSLTGLDGQISRLLLHPNATADAAMLAEMDLRAVEPELGDDIGGLTDSFHLNLTAFSLLAFIVGLFIVHAAIGLATEQRLSMFRTLRTCGISAGTLMAVLVAELVLLAVIAGVFGVIGGYLIAGALLPDVASSLRGLYGVSVPGSLSLSPTWWLAGIGMSVIGALVAATLALRTAYRLPILASAQPEAWRAAQDRGLARCKWAALALGGVALASYVLGSSLLSGFLTMACVLIAAALALPVLLDAVLKIGVRRATTPLGLWAWSDMRQQVSGLSLALMALLLALSANIGVGTMVGGFRITFLDWLDTRLAAEIYVRGVDEAEGQMVQDWAKANPDIRAVLPTVKADVEIARQPVEVLGVEDDSTYRIDWPILTAQPAAWEAIYEREAALINEQAAYRIGLDLGDPLPFDPPLQVAGIYADYGNPKSQILIARPAFDARFTASERLGTGLRLDPAKTEATIAEMREVFDLPPDRIIDQSGIKGLAREVFEKTFSITSALNVLTLAVAGMALFASMLTLADRRLPQLAPLWSMGLTRRDLAKVEMAKTLGLAALTALVAVPLGVLLAWLLVAVINVHAFGWRLPLHLFPGEWVWLALLSIAIAGLAALVPIWRLSRMQPARLLKVFADAR